MDNDTITAESQTIDPGSFKFDTIVFSYNFLNPFEFVIITVNRISQWSIRVMSLV